VLMPIYEFHCDKCQKDSELLVRSSKWEGTKCPHCGSSKLSKRLSVFASSAGNQTQAAPACGTKSSGSCGCHCAGGKHKH
jgi:putative FmdB family regulatory protein